MKKDHNPTPVPIHRARRFVKNAESCSMQGGTEGAFGYDDTKRSIHDQRSFWAYELVRVGARAMCKGSVATD